MRENGNDFVFFLLGGLAGASLALLLAPRPGRETRQLVAARMRDGERFARRGIERSRQVMERTVREGKDLAQRTLQTGREIVESAPRLSRTAPAAVPLERLT